MLDDVRLWERSGMKIDIDRGIPAPSERVKYPYRDLGVEDSFLVTGRDLQVVCNANYRMGKKLKRKFIARTESGGIRVWRKA